MNRHERLKGESHRRVEKPFPTRFFEPLVDDIVVFLLSEDDIIQIVNIMVSKLDENFITEDMGLELTRDAELFLAQKFTTRCTVPDR